MSETNNPIDEQETGGNAAETPATGDTPVTTVKSIINKAVESVMDLIDALGLFATITRGALGTKSGLCCEIAPTTPDEVYLDKNKYIPIDLTINGKNENLETLSDAMNAIHENLTFLKEYPAGTDFHIVDIATITEPQVIGRDEYGLWLMASNLSVRIVTEKE